MEYDRLTTDRTTAAQPIQALAQRHRISVELARSLVNQARNKGFLTRIRGGQRGRAGGEATPKARKVFGEWEVAQPQAASVPSRRRTPQPARSTGVHEPRDLDGTLTLNPAMTRGDRLALLGHPPGASGRRFRLVRALQALMPPAAAVREQTRAPTRRVRGVPSRRPAPEGVA